MTQERVQCLVAIVDRGRGETAAELFQSLGAPVHFACPGRGTANSDMLDYLGLGETEKDVVFTLTTQSSARLLVKAAVKKLQLSSAGKGIVFTLDLSAVSGLLSRIVHREAAVHAGKEEADKMEHGMFDLVVAAVDPGGTETMMAAAREAGARGGTVLHGRHLAVGETDRAVLGGIQPEKDIVTILVPRSIRGAVMEAVNRVGGITTEHRGILFSLPVDEIAGLSQGKPLDTQEA